MAFRFGGHTKALTGINEAAAAGRPVLLPATPRGARNTGAYGSYEWHRVSDRDDYVACYHSHDDGECANCGEDCDWCECGDYDPCSRSSGGREHVMAPPGWPRLTRNTPAGHADVGIELEVSPRGKCLRSGSGPAAKFVRQAVDAAENDTGLSFILEEDSSIPDEGFEIISGYGSWPAVARGWCHLLDSVDTHRIISGVDGSLRPGELALGELDRQLVAQRATVWNWPGGEGIIPLAELTSDTYAKISLVAPEWLAKYAEASCSGGYVPKRDLVAASSVKDRRDGCGMHVHVSAPDVVPSVSFAGRCEKVMVDFLTNDTLGYLFVVGRLPNNYCEVGSQSRYALVASRGRTAEFRGFASTLNPRMFAARVELALAIHFKVSHTSADLHPTWAEVREFVESGEAGLENLRTVLKMLPAFKASCEQQMSLPFDESLEDQVAEGCVTDPAVPGISEESNNMNVNITLNNPTVHVHIASDEGRPVVGPNAGNLVADLFGAAPATSDEPAQTQTPAGAGVSAESIPAAVNAYGSDATNEAKAQWAVGKYVNDGDVELYDTEDEDETVGKVVHVQLANGGGVGASDTDPALRYVYRSLYRAAGGFAKLGTREFGTALSVAQLRDAHGPDFIGVARVVELGR